MSADWDATIGREGRNDHGKPVLSVRCSCGWVHMTAYRRFHRRAARRYLMQRYEDHMFKAVA